MPKRITVYTPPGKSQTLTTVNAEGPMNGGYIIGDAQPVQALRDNQDYYIAVDGTPKTPKFTYKKDVNELHERL